MQHNYYSILGVSESAGPAVIRSAYRRLARQHHPDVSGEDSRATFQRIQEAWNVLHDPARRRGYDAQRAQAGKSPPRPRAGSKPTAENSLPPLFYEVKISRRMAQAGCRLSLELPSLLVCPCCAGRGKGLLLACSACGGYGRTTRVRSLPVVIPAGTANGNRLCIPFQAAVGQRQQLLLQIRVG